MGVRGLQANPLDGAQLFVESQRGKHSPWMQRAVLVQSEFCAQVWVQIATPPPSGWQISLVPVQRVLSPPPSGVLQSVRRSPGLRVTAPAAQNPPPPVLAPELLDVEVEVEVELLLPAVEDDEWVVPVELDALCEPPVDVELEVEVEVEVEDPELDEV